MNKKMIVLIVVGGILTLTFSIFAVLLLKFRRGADPNNEDTVLAEARAAAEQDDPPLVAGAYRRLTALNPFNEEYANAYCHALLRVRDFSGLDTYTNSHPVKLELTENERKTEELIERSVQMEMLGSNAVSVAALVEATNLNYYAVAPLLIASYVRNGRIDMALDATRPYIQRFPRPSLLVNSAEWCTLAKRKDLITEIRNAVPQGSGHFQLVFAYYCDALEAWDKGDSAALTKAMDAVGTAIGTPLARLMKLESVATGNDASRVELAYRSLREAPPLFDFPLRGKMAVKRFIAEHFPNEKFPDRKFSISALGQLADLVMEDGVADLDLVRVSLLAKMASNSLAEFDLVRAERNFPEDKGIKIICEQQRRKAAEAAEAKEKADKKNKEDDNA